MIQILFTVFPLFFNFANANTEVLKSCRANVEMNHYKLDLTVRALNINGELNALLIARNTEHGILESVFMGLEYSEHEVQAGLSAASERSKLNLAEALVVDSFKLTSVYKEYNTGLNLNKIRSAKIYLVGTHSQMAIVEARDEKGEVLGSFLSGPFVYPCLE